MARDVVPMGAFPKLMSSSNHGTIDQITEVLQTMALKMPRVNMAKRKHDYTVSMAVPGMKKEDFKIDVDANTLTISAKKEERKEGKDAKHLRREYDYSSFIRSFALPDDAKQDEIQATYDSGVLWLLIPKNEQTRKAVGTESIAVK